VSIDTERITGQRTATEHRVRAAPSCKQSSQNNGIALLRTRNIIFAKGALREITALLFAERRFAQPEFIRLARDRTARRMVEHHHIARAAARTAQAALEARQREIPAPRPDQGLHVQIPAVIALAIRPVIRAVATLVVAANSDTPAHRVSVAYGLDRHRRRPI